jgi:hypothetical protein
MSQCEGWFDETLPAYNMPPHDRLVASLDADIYSSTRVVLEWLASHLKAGDILYFDEFFDRTQELRAFDEFLDESKMRFRLVGATRSFTEVAFECLG